MNKKVWFITDFGRGMGTHIAKAALLAGDKVVATGRKTGAVSKAIGTSENLLVLKLDVTSRNDAEEADMAQRLFFDHRDLEMIKWISERKLPI